MIDWHHLFGWTLMDYFTGSNYHVDLEKDLSVKPQLLDVVIIEKSTGSALSELPDGLENLSKHNLLTYKSLHETLDTLVIAELLSYYVNYRKLLSPKAWEDLSLSDFRLYAVTTRYPRKLSQEFKNDFQEIKEGVYALQFGNHHIQVIVLSQMPQIKKNALWQLFCNNPDGFKFGRQHYKWRYPPAIALLNPLITMYGKKGVNMPYTLEEAVKECVRDTLESLPPAERLRGLPLSEVVQYFSPADVVKQFSPADVVQYFSPAEMVKPLSIEERLSGLSQEDIEEYLAKLKQK